MIGQYKYVHNLINKYNYHKLPEDTSKYSRNLYSKYMKLLGYDVSGSTKKVVSHSGILISNGYNRIVIGDYGAMIEITPDQLVRSNICIEDLQRLSISKSYKYRTKYLSYVTYDGITKIYLQLRTVSYADYKVNHYYVNPDNIYLVEDYNNE